MKFSLQDLSINGKNVYSHIVQKKYNTNHISNLNLSSGHIK